jgi:site-specific DNA recombinase
MGAFSKKVALYIRVSTDAQFEEGYSVDAQKEKLEQYCKLKDIKNFEFFIDGGWSGSNIDRPEMKRMIEEITEGKICAVVVYKLDRLSRSQKDTIFLLEDVFNPNKCDFISLNENFDTTTPYGKAMIGILSVFAQLERENIRDRTRMGMYERVKAGLWMGGGRVPFGYDYDKNKDILIPNKHAEDVRQIYDLYLQGYSTTQLANMFDVANDKHITNILDRITYLGKIQFRGEIIEGQHEAIIDEETWNRVQIERQKRSTKNAITSSYLLTGLIYCGKCGARMRYQRWGKKGLKIYCYSQQTSKMNLVKDPDCDNMRIDACDLEDIVIKSLFDFTKNITSVGKTIDIKSSAISVLQQKYDTIAAKIKRLYNLYAKSEDELLLETIEENKDELIKISKALENEKKTSNVALEINEKHEIIKNLKNAWESMSMMEKQHALRLCIDRIEIADNVIDIKYNF